MPSLGWTKSDSRRLPLCDGCRRRCEKLRWLIRYSDLCGKCSQAIKREMRRRIAWVKRRHE